MKAISTHLNRFMYLSLSRARGVAFSFLLCVCVCSQVGLGDIVSLTKPWKKLNTEDLLGGDSAALAFAVKVSTAVLWYCSLRCLCLLLSSSCLVC